ncbi:MAG: glycosyltransferase family 39 protein [Elusimicrobiota bacterium]
MKLYHWIVLLFLISTSIFFNLQGTNWGVPSKERTELVFPEQFRNESFYLLMKQTRDDIYKLSGGSPVGRLKDSSSSLSPILQSMGVQEKENLFFDGNKKMLTNFIRPYLLRSNHTDEQMTISSLGGMHPKSFDFNPRIFPYGGVYIYGMGAVLGISHILGVVKINRDLNFYFKQPEEMGKIFTVGRFVNIIFSVLTALLIFLITKKCCSVNAALLSVLFYIVCPAIVFQTHIMKPYIIATFFAIGCLYYSVMMITTPTVKNYILAGILAGLTAGTTPVYAFIIIAPLTAHFIMSKKITKNLFFTFLAGVFIFFITNPYWLINYKDVLSEMKTSANFYNLKEGAAISDFFLKQLPLTLPAGLLFISLIGLIYAIYRKKKCDIIFILTCTIPLLIFGWLTQTQQLSMHNSRFLLPWVSILLIPGAGFISGFLDKKYKNLPVIFFTGFAVIQATLISAICLKNFTIDGSAYSTRLSAGKWIIANIPSNSIIGTNYMPEPSHLPPFDFSKYRIEVIRNYDIKKWPEYFIFINEVPKEIVNGKNYTLIQNFKPVESILGFSFTMGNTHVNSPVYILKRIF